MNQNHFHYLAYTHLNQNMTQNWQGNDHKAHRAYKSPWSHKSTRRKGLRRL